ncbi:DMT family transporter [Rubrobacter marinus]|uniref:DMT family transporter n=1 Tax=Rubrobacter marinus TaxID=2653852 RepID=UPI001D19226E|nr:DMT family transporter [Rubrobacter marinus]
MTENKARTAARTTELSLILAAIFWGANYAATKYAAGFLPPTFLVALRFAGGGLLLLLVLRLLEPGSRLTRGELLPMIGLGCFGVAAAQTSFTFGVSMTTASNTGLIFATAPVWGMILASALGLERPTAGGMIGVALSILGVGIVVYDGLGAAGTSTLGDGLVLLASVCVGAYTVLSIPVLDRHSPLAVATYPTLFASPVALLLAAPFLPGLDWGGVTPGAWATVGYSAAFATAFAFAAWQRGISRIGANRVLVYQYLITLTGVASGIVFFGESLGPEQLLGGAVILLGVYLARRPS